jgi:hypothetical protein
MRGEKRSIATQQLQPGPPSKLARLTVIPHGEINHKTPSRSAAPGWEICDLQLRSFARRRRCDGQRRHTGARG